jgi:hypothetical protein
MADISDVMDALRASVALAIYPNGSGQPSVLPPPAASTAPSPARIYCGWPNSAKLDSDMAAGIANVSIFPKTGMTRNTTRYQLGWEDSIIVPATITASVTNSTANYAGSGGVRQIAGIRSNGVAYAHVASAADTPSTVAAALAAQVPGAVLSGASVTVPGAVDVEARVVGFNTAAMETRRQVQELMIAFWTPTPSLRHAAAALVDVALSQLEFLPLADGSNGRLLYVGDFIDDMVSKDAMWRRDLYYTVEFPTVVVQVQPTMLWGLTALTPGPGAVADLIG